MIITEAIPYGIIKAELSKYGDKRITIVSCNACARVCGTGGEEVANEMAEKLKKDGFNVASVKVVPVCCNLSVCKKIDIEGDVVLLLGCDASHFALQQCFPNKTIINGTRTIALGARDDKGRIYEVKRFANF